MRIEIGVIAALLLVLGPGATQAQLTGMERQEAHERLDVFVGRWVAEGVVHTPDGDVESSGRSEYSWKLDGTWLEEVMVGEIATMGTIHGATLIAHDKEAGDYYGVWYDSLTPRTYPFRARWISEDEFLFESEFDEPFRMSLRYTFKGRDLVEIVHQRTDGEGASREASRLTLRRELEPAPD